MLCGLPGPDRRTGAHHQISQAPSTPRCVAGCMQRQRPPTIGKHQKGAGRCTDGFLGLPQVLMVRFLINLDVVQHVANTGCGWNGRGKRGAFYKQTTGCDCEQHPGSVHITVPPTPFTSCSVECNHWHRTRNEQQAGRVQTATHLKVCVEARSPFECAMRMHACMRQGSASRMRRKAGSRIVCFGSLRPCDRGRLVFNNMMKAAAGTSVQFQRYATKQGPATG